MTHTQELITHAFPELQLQLDLPLGPLTYFKVGGPAEVFVEAKQKSDALRVLEFCAQAHIRVTVIGGASNVVVVDEGIPGVVLRLSHQDYEMLSSDQGQPRVRAGVGFKTALFVRKTIDNQMSGLEYFLGVPGQLGGAIFNNAHYLSHLVGQYIDRVEVWSPDQGCYWLSHDECEFGYDASRFHRTHEVILSAEFRLKPGNKEESLHLIREATEYRAKTQPLGEPSSGCFFRNAPNTDHLKQLFPQFADRSEVPAGFLIDQAGLKGHSVGGVAVSSKHASFLINTGKGTSHQALELAQQIQHAVKQQFGVELFPEVFVLQ